jgi:hypothetical protein
LSTDAERAADGRCDVIRIFVTQRTAIVSKRLGVCLSCRAIVGTSGDGKTAAEPFAAEVVRGTTGQH